ncbi:GDP-mannose transporter into the lumen of the Golgi, partial [Tulasnella sp. 417]
MASTPPRRNSGALSPRVSSFNINADSKQKDLSSSVNRDDDIVELRKNAGANNDNSAWAAALPVVSYCGASIMMTVVNKFVVSGAHFSMNFLLLAMQSIVCILCVVVSKRFGLISFRDFDVEDAKRWFPISFLLVCVIYTGSKSLQFLSIPVYTIFKNLTIILIAYGEVLWFGGAVTNLTLCSFVLM